MILVNLWDQILGKSIKTGKFENVNLVNILFFPMFSFSSFSTNFAKLLIAQNALQREWGNSPFANWNGTCWGLPLKLVQLIKINFLPHLESFMWEQKFEKKFFKKSHIQTPNGVVLIFKLPFPNGSYRNWVCRALWAQKLWPKNF